MAILKYILVFQIIFAPQFAYSINRQQNLANSTTSKNACSQTLATHKPGFFQKAKQVIKENIIPLSGLAYIPFAAASGVNAVEAVVPALMVTSGMGIMQMSIHQLIDSMEKLIPRQYHTAIVALSANLASGTIVAGSALMASNSVELSNSASVALGSAATITIVQALAFLTAFKKRAISEGVIKPGQKILWTSKAVQRIHHSLLKYSRKQIGKQLSWAGLFAAEALIFQLYIKEAVANENMVPLALFTASNVLILGKYFYDQVFSNYAKFHSYFSTLKPNDYIDYAKRVVADDKVNLFEREKLYILLKRVENLKRRKNSESQEAQELILKHAEQIGQNLENNRKLTNHLNALFEMDAGRNRNSGLSLPILRKLVFGITGIVGSSYLLHEGVHIGVDLIPSLGQSAGLFLALPILLGFGEFYAVKNNYLKARDNDAGKIIADSGAINILWTTTMLGVIGILSGVLF